MPKSLASRLTICRLLPALRFWFYCYCKEKREATTGGRTCWKTTSLIIYKESVRTHPGRVEVTLIAWLLQMANGRPIRKHVTQCEVFLIYVTKKAKEHNWTKTIQTHLRQDNDDFSVCWKVLELQWSRIVIKYLIAGHEHEMTASWHE